MGLENDWSDPMKQTLMTLALIAAPFAVVADDQKMPREGARMDDASLIRRFDQDGDGRLSRQESADAAVERANRRFDQLDRNKDGYITEDEVRTARATVRERMKDRAASRWQAADKDGDGALSRSEAEAGTPMLFRRFDQFDKNKDGRITRDEMPQGKHMDGMRPGDMPSK